MTPASGIASCLSRKPRWAVARDLGAPRYALKSAIFPHVTEAQIRVTFSV